MFFLHIGAFESFNLIYRQLSCFYKSLCLSVGRSVTLCVVAILGLPIGVDVFVDKLGRDCAVTGFETVANLDTMLDKLLSHVLLSVDLGYASVTKTLLCTLEMVNGDGGIFGVVVIVHVVPAVEPISLPGLGTPLNPELSMASMVIHRFS